jgi:hypothetical protein
MRHPGDIRPDTFKAAVEWAWFGCALRRTSAYRCCWVELRRVELGLELELGLGLGFRLRFSEGGMHAGDTA